MDLCCEKQTSTCAVQVLGAKVKVAVCLIKHHAIKLYGGVEVLLHMVLVVMLGGSPHLHAHSDRGQNLLCAFDRL
jgi:hypothetical protein